MYFEWPFLMFPLNEISKSWNVLKTFIISPYITWKPWHRYSTHVRESWKAKSLWHWALYWIWTWIRTQLLQWNLIGTKIEKASIVTNIRIKKYTERVSCSYLCQLVSTMVQGPHVLYLGNIIPYDAKPDHPYWGPTT